MKAVKDGNDFLCVVCRIERNQGNGGRAGVGRLHNRRGIERAVVDTEFGMAAQGARQQLGLHAVGIGDQYTNRLGRGGEQLHKSPAQHLVDVADFRDGRRSSQGKRSQNLERAFKTGIADSLRARLRCMRGRCGNEAEIVTGGEGIRRPGELVQRKARFSRGTEKPSQSMRQLCNSSVVM